MGVASLAVDNDSEKPESERLNLFYEFAKAKKADATGMDAALEKDLLGEAKRLEIMNKAAMVLCPLIFDAKILAQIKANKRLLLKFTNGNNKAQKYLMAGIEKTIETNKAALLPKVAVILKAFYDEDILEEEVILEWGTKVSKKYVSKELSEQIHEKAEKFLTWLKEAEEESEDDDEVELDSKAKISTIKEKQDEQSNGKSKESTPAIK